VSTVTRGIAPVATSCLTSVKLSALPASEVIYYDFTNQSDSLDINGNRGCTVEISGPPSGSADNYGKFGVAGQKTIIVKGGNVYINSDLYYADAKSLLGIVVLRDTSDRKNGGNIYVNPKVTNIVGTAFAEGSVMSYDKLSNKLYTSDSTVEGELTRQLLWYGNVGSANSVG